MTWKWGTPLTLKTENFELHSIDANQIPDQMIDWYADADTMLHMNDDPNLDRDQLSRMFSIFDNKYKFALLVRSKTDGTPVGLFRIFLDGRHHKAETSILIGNKDYWGKNAVIEIRERIMGFLFNGIKLNKICGSVRARNFPALFNYTKQGFDREGILKKQVLGRDGNFEDVVVFGMLREKWLEKNKAQITTSDPKQSSLN